MEEELTEEEKEYVWEQRKLKEFRTGGWEAQRAAAIQRILNKDLVPTDVVEDPKKELGDSN